jgi:hypothetical protein
MIRVVCGCGRVFKAEDRHAGKRTKCPVCGTTLTIGGTPVSSSSGGDFDEVPSWWYPSDPQGPSGPGTTSVGSGSDVDLPQTAVFPPNTDPSHTNVLANPSRLPVQATGARVQASAQSFSRVRRLWALSAGTATLAVLALGAIVWMRSANPHGGRATKGVGLPSVKSRDTAPSLPRSASPRAIPSRTAAAGTGGSSVTAGDAPSPGRSAEENIGGGLPTHRARRLRLLVPAYIYPGGDGRREWRRLIAVASKVDVVAIANPDSGPGSASNPDYAAVIAEASSHGVKLVGYVNTRYAARTLAEVKKDIDAWVEFYPQIAGFFLDQQSRDAQHAGYYAELRAYARGKLHDSLVIANPGTPCDKMYLERRASDVTCVFAYYEGFGAFELPADLAAYEPSRFAALAYKVADVETMRAMVKDAILKRIGYIYITDGAPLNQWNKLPGYWEAEVDAVSRVQ